MTYVLGLDNCHPHLSGAVGGKATGLGSLLREGVPVPPGFAVATRAYREFVASSRLDRAIRRLLAEVDPDCVEAGTWASERIRVLFEEAEPSGELRCEVAKAYLGMGSDRPVAVRSSAVCEDAAEASFAGEHETFLWVRGAEAVCRSVLRCWASLFTPQALSYFARLHMHPDETAMGVVVQTMVEAEAAGVMITVDPVTGDRSQISIEGSYGLGVAVVGGEVTPDRFLLDKVTLEPRRVVISDKPVAYRPDGDVVRLVPVPEEQASEPCVTEAEVREIASLGKRLERSFGAAQDIEWAIGPGAGNGRAIYLLQVRPETVWNNRPPRPVASPEEPILSRMMKYMSTPMRLNDLPTSRVS